MARLAIRMPKMSMTMTEGEVSAWMVEVGDAVAEGDVVCEVMTDKVDMEVESTVSGTLVEIEVASGMAEVGAPIAWVEGEDTGGGFGDLLAAPGAEESAPAPVADAEPAPVDATPVDDPTPSAAGPVAAVPRARGLAADRGIDLAAVTGSGPDGLVLVSDVEALVSPAAPPAPAAPVAASPSSSRRTAVRRAVARTMTPTALIPQFTVWREIDLESAAASRNGISWTTILLRAYAASLRAVPELLSRWEDDGPTEPAPPAVALAVATDRGLLVPIFVEPDLGDAAEVDAEIRTVVQQAHTGKLGPGYLGVANASLSNLGGMGVDRFQALLTPPQGSVLSLGSIRQRPVAVTGGVGLALTVEAGITVDHRIADGAHGAALLTALDAHLQGG
jgi:pyruvate dehydrogenase E2 component (dihydrolipoamide acetyltransferase)